MKNGVFDIILAHSHPIVLAGLSTFLEERPEFRISAKVISKLELPSISDRKPDLLILDYAIPGFLSLDDLTQVLDETRGMNVLIISADENRNSILTAYNQGIKGFVTQDCSREELVLAVQTTASGGNFFSSKILNVILDRNLPEKKVPALSGLEEESGSLTMRETEILKFLAQGNSTQKIADALFLSPHTVQTHRKSIIRKLRIKSPTQFVIHAMDLGILHPKK